MIARDRTVLPDPDSPTMPSVLPWSNDSDTPCDGPDRAALVAKETWRSSTSREA